MLAPFTCELENKLWHVSIDAVCLCNDMSGLRAPSCTGRGGYEAGASFFAASKLDRRFLSDPRGVTASWAEKDGL